MPNAPLMCRSRPRGSFLMPALLLAFLTAFGGGAVAATQDAPLALAPAPLRVLTRVAPPFVIRDDSGAFTGIAIDLWDRIAEDAGFEYRLVESDLDGMIDGVASGEADAAVGALTVTAEREAVANFSQPYYTSGLGIAVSGGDENRYLGVLRAVFSLGFLTVVLTLLGVLLIAGSLVWFFERGHNSQFGGRGARGLGAGLWWSAVTMTTVGYGDKAPVTPLGRAVGIVWMFTSVVIISGFTASIASSLTISGLGSDISSPEDLPGHKVATVQGSTAASYLRAEGISAQHFPDTGAALAALAGGEVQAVVADMPILRYLVARRAAEGAEGDLAVLPTRFDEQYYALALPPGSPLREEIDRLVLSITHEPEWHDLVTGYLGGG